MRANFEIIETGEVAKIEREVLSDGSKVYNVHFRLSSARAWTMRAGCQSAGHARALFRALENVCWFEDEDGIVPDKSLANAIDKRAEQGR